jgi:hypothetical protein
MTSVVRKNRASQSVAGTATRYANPAGSQEKWRGGSAMTRDGHTLGHRDVAALSNPCVDGSHSDCLTAFLLATRPLSCCVAAGGEKSAQPFNQDKAGSVAVSCVTNRPPTPIIWSDVIPALLVFSNNGVTTLCR